MRPGHWMAVDYLIGAAAALFGLLTSVQDISSSAVAMPARILLAAVIFFSIALRRSYPVPAFGALVTAAALASVAGPVGPPLALLAAAYVLFTVTVTGTRQTGIAALGLALAVLAVIVLLVHYGYLPADRGNGVPVVAVGFALVIAWMTGYSVRQRRLYAVTLQDQAASSAVAEERLRIARELHDVVAHSMSVIAVQAGYGQYVIDRNPADAKDALGAIQATSRDALEEMRRMLGVLRQQDAAPGPVLADPGTGTGTAAPPAGPAMARPTGLAMAIRAHRLPFPTALASPGPDPRHWHRRPGSPTSTGSSSAPAVPVSRSPWSYPGESGRSPRAWTCRRTGSSRRRSPTWSGTPAAASGARSAWGMSTRYWRYG